MYDKVIEQFDFFDLYLDRVVESGPKLSSNQHDTSQETSGAMKSHYTESNMNNDTLDTIDCEKLNSNISNAICVYENEITKVSEINSQMDALKHKYKKTMEWVENMNSEVESFRNFAKKYFEPTLPSLYSGMNEQIDQIGGNLQTCETFMNDYVEKAVENNKPIYTTAKCCVQSLDKVFCVLKRNKYSCPICIQKEISMLVVPCGHTYCKQCSTKMDANCFICRQPIIKVSPLFFDE